MARVPPSHTVARMKAHSALRTKHAPLDGDRRALLGLKVAVEALAVLAVAEGAGAAAAAGARAVVARRRDHAAVRRLHVAQLVDRQARQAVGGDAELRGGGRQQQLQQQGQQGRRAAHLVCAICGVTAPVGGANGRV